MGTLASGATLLAHAHLGLDQRGQGQTRAAQPPVLTRAAAHQSRQLVEVVVGADRRAVGARTV